MTEKPCDFGEFLDPGYAGCTHGEAIPRDRWTRPVVNGKSLTRVSTLAKLLEDQTGLKRWLGARTIEGFTNRRDLRDAAVTVLAAPTDDTENKLREIAELAAEAGGAGQAATRGTALHAISLAGAVSGTISGLADEAMVASHAAMVTALEAENLQIMMVEQFVVNRRMGYAGSIDAYLRSDVDGRWYTGDVKTSVKLNDLEWSKGRPVAVQLRGYALGKRWCPEYGDLRTPPVDTEIGWLISVPLDAGRAVVTPVDIGGIGKEGLELAVWAHKWRKSDAVTAAARKLDRKAVKA
jgi:hypothetical protein